MRPFACSYTPRQKTASRVTHYSPAVALLSTDACHLLFSQSVPITAVSRIRRSTAAFAIGARHSTAASQSRHATAACAIGPPHCGFTTARHHTETHTEREPNAASYKPRATSYASRVASIARRALTASPIVFVSIPCARNSSESSSHERYPTAMTTVSKPRNS